VQNCASYDGVQTTCDLNKVGLC